MKRGKSCWWLLVFLLVLLLVVKVDGASPVGVATSTLSYSYTWISPSDYITLSAQDSLSLSRSLSESVGTTKSLSISNSLSQSVSLSESSSLSLSISVSLSESRSLSLSPSLSLSFSLSNSRSLSLSPSLSLSLSLSNSLSLSLSNSLSLSLSPSLSNSLSISNSRSLSFSRSISISPTPATPPPPPPVDIVIPTLPTIPTLPPIPPLPPIQLPTLPPTPPPLPPPPPPPPPRTIPFIPMAAPRCKIALSEKQPYDPYSDSYARVRLMNFFTPLEEDIGANFSLIINNVLFDKLKDIQLFQTSAYTKVPRGPTVFLVKVLLNGAFFIAEMTTPFTPGVDYTILLQRRATLNSNGEATGPDFNIRKIVDNNYTPKLPFISKVRVINVAIHPQAPPLNFLKLTTVTLPLQYFIEPGDISPYIEVPAVPTQFAVTPPTGYINVIYFNPFYLPYFAPNLGVGTYTAVAFGDLAGSPSSLNSFGLCLIADSVGDPQPDDDIDPEPFLGNVDPNDAFSTTLGQQYVRLRFAHFSAPNSLIQISVDSLDMSPPLAFGSASPYISLLPGKHYIVVRNFPTQLVLQAKTIYLTEGYDQTFVVQWRLNPDNPLIRLVTAQMLIDDNQMAPEGFANVRFVSAMHQPIPLDIYLERINVVPELRDFGVSLYIPVNLRLERNKLPLTIVGPNSSSPIYQEINFEANKYSGGVYTVWISGTATQLSIYSTLDNDRRSPDELSKAMNEFEAFVLQFLEKYKIAGVSIAVLEHNDRQRRRPERDQVTNLDEEEDGTREQQYGIVWSSAYGVADVERDRRVTKITNFLAGSISTIMVATLAFQAISEKKFSLNDTLTGLFGFAIRNPTEWKVEPTVGHLLTHTSTIVDNWLVLQDLVVKEGDPKVSTCDFVEQYTTLSGLYYSPENWLKGVVPGTTFSFSHVGISIVACLLERVYETDFIGLFDNRIASVTVPPMQRSSWRLSARVGRAVSQQFFYDRYSKKYGEVSRASLPIFPAFGLRTTVGDLGSFLLNVLSCSSNCTVLQREDRRKMLTRTNITTPQGEYLAYGWLISSKIIPNTTLIGQRVFTRFGDTKIQWGISGEVWFDPLKNRGVTILGNTNDDEKALDLLVAKVLADDTYNVLQQFSLSSISCNYNTEDKCDLDENCKWLKSTAKQANGECVKLGDDMRKGFKG